MYTHDLFYLQQLCRPLPTLSPSLIGHLASVDVKHQESKRGTDDCATAMVVNRNTDTHLHMQIYFTRKDELLLVLHRLPMLFVARLLGDRPLCALKFSESVSNDYDFSSVQCEYRPNTKLKLSVNITSVQNECASPFCILTRT